MSDMINELEKAARLTKRMVDGLTWLEKQGPSKARLECLCRDMERLSKDFQKNITSSKQGEPTEINKMRDLLGTIGLMQRHLHEASEHLFLRIHVLDALEQFDKDENTKTNS